MHNLTFDLVQYSVREEIERLVGKAFAEGRIVHTGRNAKRILDAFPNCGLGLDTVMNEIGATAAGAGVPVEFGRAEEPTFPAET